MEASSVKVAVRVRPMSGSEQFQHCKECVFCPDSGDTLAGHRRNDYTDDSGSLTEATSTTSSSPCSSSSSPSASTQPLILGSGPQKKVFTFDFVCGPEMSQSQVFMTCVGPLLDRFIEGYNGTILAYGQTGSGKTFSMGTATMLDQPGLSLKDPTVGIIPRAAMALFAALKELEAKAQRLGYQRPIFEVRASFLELYNEELVDLLNRDNGAGHNITMKDSVEGGVNLVGLTDEQITTPAELLNCLARGAANRTTAATDMNSTSSRSHAIFTVTLKQKLPVGLKAGEEARPEGTLGGESAADDGLFESLHSKFHFVDLAGSERMKKTNAVGERAKEAININLGLFTLGRVISALGDESKRDMVVPYRESKLTRILQNSLGGNSRTLMIACVSPSDSNFMETLNTLNYANNVRNIKNKVVINRDLDAMEADQLRKQILILKQQLLLATSGSAQPSAAQSQKIAYLESERKSLGFTLQQHQERISGLENELLESQILIAHLQELVPLEKRADLEALKDLETKTRESGSSLSAQTTQLELISTLKNQLAEARQQSDLHRFQLQELQRAPRMPEIPGFKATGRLSIGEQWNASRSFGDALSRAKAEVEELERMLSSPGPRDPVHPDLEEGEDFHGDASSGTDEDDHNDPDEAEANRKEKQKVPEAGSEQQNIEPQESSANMLKKLEEIQRSITDKEELVGELERAEQEIYQLKLEFEGKLIDLLQEKTDLMKERDRALEDMVAVNRSEKELDIMRDQYEKKLKALVEQINTYRQKLADNQKSLKLKTQTEQQIPALKQTVEELRAEKQELVRKIREEQKTNKSFKNETSKELKRLLKLDMQKTTYIKQLEKNNETQRNLLKTRVEETVAVKTKLKTIQQEHQQKLDAQRKQLSTAATTKAAPARVLQREQQAYSSATQKKAQLDRDLDKCVLARETNHIMEVLLKKREVLVAESVIVTDLRGKMVVLKKDAKRPEERLAFLSGEISKLNRKIAELQEEIMSGGATNGKEIYDQAMYHIRLYSPIEARKILQLVAEDSIQWKLEIRKKDAHVHYLKTAVAELEESLSLARATASNWEAKCQMLMKGKASFPVGEGRPAFGQSNTESADMEVFLGENDSETDSGFLVVPRVADHDLLMGDYSLIHEEDPSLVTRKRSGSAPEPVSAETKQRIDELMKEAGSPQAKNPDILSALRSESDERERSHSFRLSRESGEGSPGSSRARSPSPVPGESVFSRLAPIPRKEPSKKKHEIIQEEISLNSNKMMECTHTLKGHLGAVFAVAVQGDKIYSASQDSTVKIWDVAQGEVTTVTAFTGFVRAIVVASGLLFTACEMLIKVWDLNGTQLVKTLAKQHQRDIVALATNPSETMLFSSSIDNTVCVWDLKTLAHLRTIKGFKNAVTSFEFYGSWLLTGSKDRTIRIHDMTTFDIRHQLDPPHYDSVSCLALSGDVLFSGGGSQFGFIKQWNLKTLSSQVTANNAHKESVQSMTCLRGGLLLSAAKDGILKVWNAETFESMLELKAHEQTINQLVRHPANPALFFTASNDKTVRVWRVRFSSS